MGVEEEAEEKDGEVVEFMSSLLLLAIAAGLLLLTLVLTLVLVVAGREEVVTVGDGAEGGAGGRGADSCNEAKLSIRLKATSTSQ